MIITIKTLYLVEWLFHLDVIDIVNLLNFTVGFKCCAAKKPGSEDTKSRTSLIKKIANKGILSQIKGTRVFSLFQLISKTIDTFKSTVVNSLWELLVILRLDKIVNPIIKNNFFLILKITFKWIWRSISLFNLILVLWLFYFNTPVITGKLILGWLGDFFRVAWTSYTDTCARFLDYINQVIEHGFNSVPRKPRKPIEYPNGGFIKEYREVFRKIRELAPTLSDTEQPSRWYDSLRDKYIDQRPKFNFIPDSNFNNNIYNANNNLSFINNMYQFMKDYWHVGAVIGGSIVVIGGLFFFWDPITTTLVSAGTSVKDGLYSLINYITGRGPGPSPDGGSGGDNSSIVIGELDTNPDSLNNRLPEIPSTPMPSVGELSPENGSLTPTGSITPTPANTSFVGDSTTPRFRAPELKFSYSGGSNPWEISSTLNSASTQSLLNGDRSQIVPTNVEQLTPSSSGLKLDTNVSTNTVQNSPIMSKLNSMDSSKFSVNSSNIEISPTKTEVPSNIGTSTSSQLDLTSNMSPQTEISSHINSEAQKATEDLIHKSSGAKTFTDDFNQSSTLIFFLLDKISSPFMKCIEKMKRYINNYFTSKVIINMDTTLDHDNLMDDVIDVYQWLDKNNYHDSKFFLNTDTIFEWQNIESFNSDKFENFSHYKHYIFDKLLFYVFSLAILKQKGIEIDSLAEYKKVEILALKSMLDFELNNLYYYTNIENSLDSYLLYSVFTRKALNEIKVIKIGY